MIDCSDIDVGVVSGFLLGLRPEPLMKVSEWANAKRILPDTSAMPGPYRTEFTPWIKEISDRLSVSDPAQRIYVMKSSQTGLTETGNNWLGYVIDLAPAPFLYIMPTDTAMKDTSTNRIEKMIESTEDVRVKVAKARSKEKRNNLTLKEFANGFLKAVGANSPVGLSSMAVRYVYGDEIDRFPKNVGGEGSAVKLAETRTITFSSRKKIFLTSTPTLKGISEIDSLYSTTGQRVWQVPCPHCECYQQLVIENIVYEKGKENEAKYKCKFCEQLIEERYKTRMNKVGKFVALYPEKEDGITYGYFINSLNAPSKWITWGQLVKERDEVETDIPKKITFINTKLGLPYEESEGEKLDWELLFDRAENYEVNKPFASVVFITAGVDVQADRLEVEIVGWMKGKSSQSIDYRVLYGDTSQDEVWQDLGKLLDETWTREGDNCELIIRAMAVDTGYNTKKGYDFAKKHGLSRVFPIKGKDSLDMLFQRPSAIEVTKTGKKVGRVKVWHVGVSMIKSEVYGFLKISIDKETGHIPNGYCHFPVRDARYFRGLVSEEIVIKQDAKGYDKYQWEKKVKRNEPLDCRVYARAASAIMGMDKWNDDRWAREHAFAGVAGRPKNKPAAKKEVVVKKSSWL